MASSVDQAYDTARILAAQYSHAKASDTLKIEHFSTDEKVINFCAEVFDDIYTNQEILTSPVSLEGDEDVFPTTVEVQIRNLSSSLESKRVSEIYRQIFQNEVIAKLDVICAVDPRVFPAPQIFSLHLESLHTMVADDELRTSRLNTDEAVKLFADSFFRMLANNKLYLSDEKVTRLVGKIAHTLQSSIFDTVVLQGLPDLVREGKQLKKETVQRMKLEIMNEVSLYKEKHADLNKQITDYLTKPGATFNSFFIQALYEASKKRQKPTEEMVLNLSEEELNFVLEVRDISWHINTLQIGVEMLE